MLRLSSLPNSPTAVMTADDSMAIDAMKAAYDGGLRVLDDISVVGFDDVEVTGYTVPGLTTVHHAIDGLLVLISEKKEALDQTVIPVKSSLMVRQSTVRVK